MWLVSKTVRVLTTMRVRHKHSLLPGTIPELWNRNTYHVFYFAHLLLLEPL